MMISEVTRRDILDYLLLPETPGLFGRLEVVEFLDRVFQVRSSKDKWSPDRTMADEIGRHYLWNDDWDPYFLFVDYLDILNVDDVTFLNFLSCVLHPVVRKTEKEAQAMAFQINTRLKYAGSEMVVVDTQGGRPVYGSLSCELVRKELRGAPIPNYHLVAVDLASKGKDRHTLAQLSLRAEAIFGVEKMEHPRQEFTSSKAQLIYDWIMTVADLDEPECWKIDRLTEFATSLIGADPVLGLPTVPSTPASEPAIQDAPAVTMMARDQVIETGEVKSTSESVWVIHGRDERARRAMFDFLRALHLKPIEWSHAVATSDAASPFIGDVIDNALNQAQAVVVLFTGDDKAVLNPTLYAGTEGNEDRTLQPQPRPNVLFEAGMAYGRVPDRTIIVEMGKIRHISDLAGRHTIRMDNSSAQRNALAQRLIQAGCAVNMVGNDWLETGDFRETSEAK